MFVVDLRRNSLKNEMPEWLEYTQETERNCMQRIVNMQAKLTGGKECSLNVLFVYADLVL